MCACTESDVRESATRLHLKRPIRFTLARALAVISANDSFCYRQLTERYARNVPAPRSLPGFLLGWTPCTWSTVSVFSWRAQGELWKQVVRWPSQNSNQVPFKHKSTLTVSNYRMSVKYYSSIVRLFRYINYASNVPSYRDISWLLNKKF
jgi:hypothetical protein